MDVWSNKAGQNLKGTKELEPDRESGKHFRESVGK